MSRSKEIEHYKVLYLKYAPMLLRFAQKFIDVHFVEDIVHDVFVRLWDKQIFRLPESEVKKILYTAVRNACIDHLRKLKLAKRFVDHHAIQLKLDELDFFKSSEGIFMQHDMMAIILKHIEELPEKKQQIFRMSYLQQMKANEIARDLNLSVRTVENQLYRTLLILRKKIPMAFIYLFVFFKI
uniref:RNA polymerase, sigma-24 subunit, ECF subfamily n=1 Tax=Sphingobacterium sp. (strain 21) TaxID=743722 RepID=F4C6E1_SPHS2